MSLWSESLSVCLYDCVDDIEARTQCIFEHLSMEVPRSWWETTLKEGHIQDDYVEILHDSLEELRKLPDLKERVDYAFLIALAFADDTREGPRSKSGDVSSQYSLEEYVARAQKVLAEHDELRQLGEMIRRKFKPK
jgi:hypothetical protein